MMNRNSCFVLGMLVVPLALLGLGIAYGGSVSTPNTFTAGTSAVAAEVNANFDAHETAINDNDSRVTANGASLSAQDARITALEGAILPQAIVRVHYMFGVMADSITVATNSVNNLPGGATPTVSSPAAGVYDVDFGTDVSSRFIQVTPGASSGNSTALLLNAVEKRAAVSAQVLSNQDTIVRVEINDETGSGVPCSFFLTVW